MANIERADGWTIRVCWYCGHLAGDGCECEFDGPEKPRWLSVAVVPADQHRGAVGALRDVMDTQPTPSRHIDRWPAIAARARAIVGGR